MNYKEKVIVLLSGGLDSAVCLWLMKENNFEISSFESLDDASTNDMTFLNSSKYQELSLKTKAAACITSPNLSKFLPKKCIKLDVKNVLFAVTQVAKMFYPNADVDIPDAVSYTHLTLPTNREV